MFLDAGNSGRIGGAWSSSGAKVPAHGEFRSEYTSQVYLSRLVEVVALGTMSL